MTLGLCIFTCFNFINTVQFRSHAELRFSNAVLIYRAIQILTGMCIIIMLDVHAIINLPISVQVKIKVLYCMSSLGYIFRAFWKK